MAYVDVNFGHYQPFHSIPGALWFSLVTITAVGYGELFPAPTLTLPLTPNPNPNPNTKPNPNPNPNPTPTLTPNQASFSP